MLEFLHPEWPAPPRVRALQTLRQGGVSTGPYTSLNLGDHVGDVAENVAANRQRVGLALPASPLWLTQVHGTRVVDAAVATPAVEADGVMAKAPGVVCAVMTADCLPVLFCDRRGTVVAAAHAGWRGLCGGVLEETVAAMGVAPSSILAWLGPAIGPQAFEVGGEVREAFLQTDGAAESAFAPGQGGKWLGDLYQLARLRLRRMGITAIYGGTECTYSDATRFFSYRRDGVTGRMASLIWLDAL